jgi:nickel-dependent lactate racemase
MAGARLATELHATEVKIASVERSGDSLAAKIQITVGGLDPSQLYELGNLIEGGPMEVKLMSCQLDLGL